MENICYTLIIFILFCHYSVCSLRNERFRQKNHFVLGERKWREIQVVLKSHSTQILQCKYCSILYESAYTIPYSIFILIDKLKEFWNVD